jgi:predicted nucleic acid-binding protein
VASLVDTKILVYRWDPREPRKQAIAERLLRQYVGTDFLCVPHQAIIEFMAVVPRIRWQEKQVMPAENAIREVEELLIQFPVLYPDEAMVRMALRGMATYRLSWSDAHLWAYAEHYGMSEILSEDFEHGRRYGTVLVRNPFLDSA